MQKLKAFLLACVMLLCFFSTARSESAIPRPQGQAADWAQVLSEETKEDLSALSVLMQKEGAGSLYIATRHFLGGKEPAAYARELFDSWALTEKDALLLMVIGEERYALYPGEDVQKNLPAESRTLLLGAFRTAFLNREYDRAVGDLALQLAPLMASGKPLSADGLFGREIQLTPAPQTREQIHKTMTGLWRDMFGEIQEEKEEWKKQQQQEEVQSNWKTILIWGLVIYFLFFRKKKRKKKRRR